MQRPWLLLAAFWPVQAVVAYALAIAWLGWTGSINGPAGRPWGDLSDIDFEGFFHPNHLLAGLVGAGILTAAQAIFLLPIRRPAPRSERGRSLFLSLALAGLLIALLVVGIIFAGAAALEVAGEPSPMDSASNTFAGVLIATGALSWAVATPLLIAYSRRRVPRESFLARITRGLFAGTTIEAAAAIPLDVMVRRRADCYCDTGTFYTLSICGAVGLFALGPAVFLPLLAKRRRPYYAAHCNACGYDMAATPRLERCPECGVAWTAAAAHRTGASD